MHGRPYDMPMPGNHPPSEVRRVIGGRGERDLLCLFMIASIRAMGLRRHAADDLLIEALDNVLCGRRRWPRELAEGILDASDDEIVRLAIANGGDVDAHVKKVCAMIEERIAATEKSKQTSFAIDETLVLRSEVRRLVAADILALTPAKWARLRSLAARYAYAMPAEDLLQEACRRLLEQGRKCPNDVDVVQFLAQTMRSIASAEVERRSNNNAGGSRRLCRRPSQGRSTLPQLYGSARPLRR